MSFDSRDVALLQNSFACWKGSSTSLEAGSTRSIGLFEMKSKRKRFRILKVLLLMFILAGAYVAFDLLAPRESKMRDFDAGEVARLETAMWRSYYDRQQVKLFNQMTELLRSQYNLPLVRSNVVAYEAVRAAFVFKDGHNRADYEKALPYLITFYTSVRRVSDIPFDVNRAARLELEWWIIHRERHTRAPGALDRALAELAAELYRVPVEQAMDHARLRAEAMTIRDNKAESGGVTEQDWSKIDKLLHESWTALKQAVQSAAPGLRVQKVRSEEN